MFPPPTPTPFSPLCLSFPSSSSLSSSPLPIFVPSLLSILHTCLFFLLFFLPSVFYFSFFLLSTHKPRPFFSVLSGMTFLLHRDHNLTQFADATPDWLRIGQNENPELLSLIKDSHPCSNSPQNRSGSGIKS